MEALRFDNPFDWLHFELDKAKSRGEPEPTAMSLSTFDPELGRPDVRVVLYKGIREGGLSFFTNYNSPKSQALQKFPKATLNFYWPSLFQQVRVWGDVARLSRQSSEEYFATRPRLSQLGAWASRQSEKLSSYEDLQKKIEELDRQFVNQSIPCPPHWGGWVLKPEGFEFWYGRDGRLHERYRMLRTSPNLDRWELSLLSP